MTDQAAGSTTPDLRNPAPLPPIVGGNPWLVWLAVLGFAAIGGAALALLLPPPSEDSSGTSVVVLSAMFAQYALAIVLAMIGVAFTTAWWIAGANAWREEHPRRVR